MLYHINIVYMWYYSDSAYNEFIIQGIVLFALHAVLINCLTGLCWKLLTITNVLYPFVWKFHLKSFLFYLLKFRNPDRRYVRNAIEGLVRE